MPRDQSPCGVCIDRNATQLMHLADRCFPALLAEPRFVEALLIPFHINGKPVGTVWVVSHTEDRKFDQEDERIVRELSLFASAGWQLLQTSEALAERNRQKDDFIATLGHELRNPLGAIVAATSVLQQRTATDQGAVRALDIIARQSQHMTRLADDCSTSRGSRAASLNLTVASLTFGRLSPRPLNPAVPRSSAAPFVEVRSARSDPHRRRPGSPRASRIQPRRQCREVHARSRKPSPLHSQWKARRRWWRSATPVLAFPRHKRRGFLSRSHSCPTRVTHRPAELDWVCAGQAFDGAPRRPREGRQ